MERKVHTYVYVYIENHVGGLVLIILIISIWRELKGKEIITVTWIQKYNNWFTEKAILWNKHKEQNRNLHKTSFNI